MRIEIRQEDFAVLERYCEIPIAFQAKTVLRVVANRDGLGGIELKEEPVESWLKNYDRVDGLPRSLTRWDLSNWGFFSAFVDNQRVGGAIVAYDTENVHLLEGRRDIAALWDLRVHPDYRGKGVDTQLFQAAVDYARQRNCICLKVETQNVNVPACRFYQRQGCELGGINRFAYWHLPAEAQLIWYLDLRS